MRHVNKPASGGGYHLASAHANPPQTPDAATSRWKSYGYKSDLQGELLEEQYWLCCYTELRADLLELGYHIEHIEPKSLQPARTFDYQNLAACALSTDASVAAGLQAHVAKGHEIFGGHAKLNQYDANLFISCQRLDCARFFVWLSDGTIQPQLGLNQHEHAMAKYTIKVLNLNSPYLIDQRQAWWDELDALFSEHQQQDWDTAHLAAVDLVPTAGKLSPFFSLTRQFFGAIAEQVLARHAPQLI